MKKFTSLLLSLLLSLSAAMNASAMAVTVTVDGAEIGLKADTFSDVGPANAGDVYVPFRAVLEAMGYGVAYDSETGVATGGTFADPELTLVPGQDGTVLIDGVTYIPADRLTGRSGLAYSAELSDGVLAYTNNYDEIAAGWYTLSLGDRLLTAVTEGETLAFGLYLSEKSGGDEHLWLLREAGNKTYTLVNKATGLAADVNSLSREDGAAIIQYTLTEGANQRFTFKAAGDGYAVSSEYSRLDLTAGADGSVIQSVDGGVWGLEFAEPYVSPIDLALETDAFAGLEPYVKERFKTYFFTDVWFSREAKAKAENFLLKNHFDKADAANQRKLLEAAMEVPFADVLTDTAQEKLTADYEITGVEEKPGPLYDEELNEIGTTDYYIYTINMDCGGDTHTFTVETVDPDDEDYVRRVCEALACFEPPIRKTLRRFYYTGVDGENWLAWDGEVWNHAAYKDNVDDTVNMLAHELGHVIDSWFTVGDDVWTRAMAADMVPITDYGKTDRWEDFGEFSQLYLLSRGNDALISAIEKVYPARTRAYRAALYNLDNEYYADYKDEYEAVTAPIGDTSGIDEGMYYCITPDYLTPTPETERVLTNNGGVITLEPISGEDSQLWQIAILDDQLVQIYSKADGTSIAVPSTEPNTEVVTDADKASPLGLNKTNSGTYTIWVSETLYGFNFDLRGEGGIFTGIESGEFFLTPVEKIEGVGDFTIMSAEGKYLAVSSEESGARLTLSDSGNVWHIYKLPDGTGYITDKTTGLAVDISGGSFEEGTWLWPILLPVTPTRPGSCWETATARFPLRPNTAGSIWPPVKTAP